jgi:hypothetical protein
MERVFSSLVQGSNRCRLAGGFLLTKLLAAMAVVLALAPVAGAEEIRTTNPVVDFDSQSIVYGSATLTRKHDRISIQLKASGLTPGVYTFWWGVTNSGEDLTAGWAGSRVVGGHGKTHFAADLSIHSTRTSSWSCATTGRSIRSISTSRGIRFSPTPRSTP